MATKAPKKQKQLKIPGTERKDRISAIEEADEAYREARDDRMELQEDEASAQETLTNVMRKHGAKRYKYEGSDGRMYEVYLPEDVKAKSRRVKEPKAPKAD